MMVIKMKTIASLALCSVFWIYPMAESTAKVSIYYNTPNYQYHNRVIQWRGQTFYQNKYGVVYPHRYSKRSIQALCDYAAYHNMRYFYVMPDGYDGAVPYRWKEYVYYSFLNEGIRVVQYSNHSAKSYKRHRYKNHRYRDNSRNDGFYFRFRF